MGKLGYKHTKEALKKISLASRYRVRTASSKLKASKSLQGRKFSKETLQKMSTSQKNRTIPIEVRKKISFALKGDKSYLWKGGKILLYNQIRSCFEYRLWRSDCFRRDNYTCQDCGDNRGGNLEVHHIKAFIVILKEYLIKTMEEALACVELWDINNGKTVCKTCHKKYGR